MAKYKVAVTGKVQNVVVELLQDTCDIRYWNSVEPIPQATLYDWVKDIEGLFCSGSVRVDEALLSRARHLRVISQASVGYDNVDVAACTARGIPFGNTPGVLVEATADLTFGILLSAARRIHEGWLQVKSGSWHNNFDIPYGSDLFGKTLGIVGMGSIGAAVARRAQAFGMRVIYHNRNRRMDDMHLQTAYESFAELLRESDFLVVLVPLSEHSQGMFGTKEFAAMKSTAYFVNAARGLVVDSIALYEALRQGQIQYAALDVTDPEPIPADHPLLSLPNILITPHVGSATHETRDRMARLASSNLLAGLHRQPLQTCVNPAVNFPH